MTSKLLQPSCVPEGEPNPPGRVNRSWKKRAVLLLVLSGLSCYAKLQGQTSTAVDVTVHPPGGAIHSGNTPGAAPGALNRPAAPLRQSHGLLPPSNPAERAQFFAALRYLNNSPTARRVIARLEKSQRAYRVVVNGAPFTGEAGYASHTIYWVPTGAYEWKAWALGGWKRRSPALTLLHELGHAYHDDLDHREFKTLSEPDPLDPQWSSPEEKRTIENIENRAAEELGEPARNWHSIGWAHKYRPFISAGPASVAESTYAVFSNPLAAMRSPARTMTVKSSPPAS